MKNTRKKIGRIYRYLSYQTTLDDLREDVESDRIDFKRFQKTVLAGETFYRLVDRDEDPLRPTGRKGRFVSEPDNLPYEKYRQAYNQELWKSMVVMGTGAVTMSVSPVTTMKEVPMPQNKDFYALTLIKDVTVLDFESLRKSMRIPFCFSKERHPTYQLFYGKKLKGVFFRSAQENSISDNLGGQQPEYNLIIFTDWLEGYKSYFSYKKIDDNTRDSIINWRSSSQNSLNLCQSSDSTNK